MYGLNWLDRIYRMDHSTGKLYDFGITPLTRHKVSNLDIYPRWTIFGERIFVAHGGYLSELVWELPERQGKLILVKHLPWKFGVYTILSLEDIFIKSNVFIQNTMLITL